MSKYSPEKTAEICEYIKKLSGRVGACKKAGIHYDTFCEWMAKHTEFSEAIKDAETEARDNGKQVAIQSIFSAMSRQWQAAAWWLERNYEEYKLGTKLELSGNVRREIEINPDDLTSEELAVLRKIANGNDRSDAPAV